MESKVLYKIGIADLEHDVFHRLHAMILELWKLKDASLIAKHGSRRVDRGVLDFIGHGENFREERKSNEVELRFFVIHVKRINEYHDQAEIFVIQAGTVEIIGHVLEEDREQHKNLVAEGSTIEGIEEFT